MSKLIKENKCLEEGVKQGDFESLEEKVTSLESTVETIESKVETVEGKSGVTGVKGNAESSYRTGNVNLTPANIGALPTTGGTVTGNLTLSKSSLIIKEPAGAGMELYTTVPYLDFHYNNTTTDFTHRIIGENNYSPVSPTGYQMGLVAEGGVFISNYYGSSTNDYASYLLCSSLEYSMMGVRSSGLVVRDIANVNGAERPILASAFNATSSKRYKENIQDMSEDEANKLDEINVVTFDYINHENGINCRGVVAEDVYDIIPSVVTLAEVDGKKVPEAVDYSKFVPYLIKKVQMLANEINELKVINK